MTLGDLLDAVFQIYRNQFLTFLGIVALVYLPIMILESGLILAVGPGIMSDLHVLEQALENLDPDRLTPEIFLEQAFPMQITAFVLSSILIGLLQSLILQPIMTGALVNAVSHHYLHQPLSIFQAYQFGSSRMVSLIIASFLVSLLVSLSVMVPMGIMGALIVGMALVSESENFGLLVLLSIGTILLLLLSLLVAIILMIRLLFVAQAVVLEGAGTRIRSDEVGNSSVAYFGARWEWC